jgi:hypothetical protein
MRLTFASLVLVALAGCAGDHTIGSLKQPQATGVACGNATCPEGTECCNASCGICVSPGGTCIQQVCDPSPPSCPDVMCTLSCPNGFKVGADGCPICECKNPPPPAITCGSTTCPAGTECCNPSCGICVNPGEACTQQVCP